MKTISKVFLALIAAAFMFSTPAIAVDLPTAGAAQKPDLSGALKDKVSEAVDQAKDKADNTAEKLKQSLGKKEEAVEVKEESVTVETPQGAAQETQITVQPEGAAPAPAN